MNIKSSRIVTPVCYGDLIGGDSVSYHLSMNFDLYACYDCLYKRLYVCSNSTTFSEGTAKREGVHLGAILQMWTRNSQTEERRRSQRQRSSRRETNTTVGSQRRVPSRADRANRFWHATTQGVALPEPLDQHIPDQRTEECEEDVIQRLRVTILDVCTVSVHERGSRSWFEACRCS